MLYLSKKTRLPPYRSAMRVVSLFSVIILSSTTHAHPTLCLLSNTDHLSTQDATFLIQAGSFQSHANALRFQDHLSHLTSYPTSIEHAGEYYKVIIGPISSVQQTQNVAHTLLKQLHQSSHPPIFEKLSTKNFQPTKRTVGPVRQIMSVFHQPQNIQSLFYYDHLHWFVNLGGGAQKSFSGSTMTVQNGSNYPQPQNLDQFSINNHSSGGLLQVSTGYRWERDHDWFPGSMLGLTYQHVFNSNINGNVTQYSDPEFTNYSYQWGATTNLILITEKLNLYQTKHWSPYASVGLGIALNETGQYTESAFTGVTPRISPDYAGGSTSNFAYQFGVGLDYQLNASWLLSVGYLYQNIGSLESGIGQSTWSETSLNSGSVGQNAVLGSVTYLF